MVLQVNIARESLNRAGTQKNAAYVTASRS